MGGGISGLATSYYILKEAEAQDRSVDIIVLEKEACPGGKFLSRREAGYTVEGGPNGFLDSKPYTLELSEELGITSSLLPSDDAARRRFIYSRGRLVRLPESPMAFLRSPLISTAGKLRMLGELTAKTTPPGTDTTLAEFGRRRLGAEAVDRILDPMVSGVFAGDPERMSLRASFPRIAELEEQYGGLVKAMIHLGRERKRAKKRGDELGATSGPAGPGGTLTSFSGGISELTNALADLLGDRFKAACETHSIAGKQGSFTIEAGDAKYEADAVVLAAPAYASSVILDSLAPDSARILSKIPYSPMTVVGLGYPAEKTGDILDGFGFLIPGIENRRILGALWTSSIFPGFRAPEGKALIRVMAGGARDSKTHLLSETELLKLIRTELEQTMSLTVEPEFTTIFRWPRAIPLYTVDHLMRVDEAENSLPKGVFLTGNAYRGVGINDCVRESAVTAKKVLESIA